jgi:hypothetical protein
MPMLIPNLEKSSSVIADEHAAARCRELKLLRQIKEAPAGYYHDELMDDLAGVGLWMLTKGVGRGASLLINDLTKVTDDPLRVAIDLLLNAAGYALVQDSNVLLQKTIAVLFDLSLWPRQDPRGGHGPQRADEAHFAP